MLIELREHVGKKIGKIAAPANIVFTPELPKTRSGKIMRRLLRDVAENRPLGDTTTLADPAVVSEIDRRAKAEAALRGRKVNFGEAGGGTSFTMRNVFKILDINVEEVSNTVFEGGVAGACRVSFRRTPGIIFRGTGLSLRTAAHKAC